MDPINFLIMVLVVVALLFKLGGVVYFFKCLTRQPTKRDNRNGYDRGFDAYMRGEPLAERHNPKYVEGYTDAALQRAKRVDRAKDYSKP